MALQLPPETEHSLIVTSEAATKIKDFLKEEGKADYGFRVAVLGGGCSGFKYDMRLEEKPTESDEIIEKDGVKIFVDAASKNLLIGSQLTYVDSMQGAGFKVVNPNATGSCGCGESFST